MSKKNRTIGRYELGQKVATGGMAELYRAHLKGPYGFRKPVAIKIIRPELAQQQEFRNLFMHESRIMAAYNHRNLVQVFELGESAGQLFMSLEFIEGKDLSQILLERLMIAKPLAPTQAAYIAREVSLGLEYVHTMLDNEGNPQHIVHRDVNPGNILIAKDGQIKLGDFGIAKSTARQSQTKTGHVKGKLAYLSPEQARGEEVDAGSDIYSVGLILFEMLTLQTYIQESSQIEMLRQSANPSWRSIREINPQVPNSLENIVRRCLASQRCDRYVTAKDLSQALTGILQQAQPVTDEIAALVKPRPTHTQRPLVETTVSPKLTHDRAATTTKIDASVNATPRKPFTKTVDMDIAQHAASKTHIGKRKFIYLAAALAVMGLLWWVTTSARYIRNRLVRAELSRKYSTYTTIFESSSSEVSPFANNPSLDALAPIPLPQEKTTSSSIVDEPIMQAPEEQSPHPVPVQPNTRSAELIDKTQDTRPRLGKSSRKARTKSNRDRPTTKAFANRAKKAENALFVQFSQRLSTYRKKIRTIGLKPGDLPHIDRQLATTQQSIAKRETKAAQENLRNLSKVIDSVRIDQKFIENKLKRLDRTLGRLNHKGRFQEQIRDILDHTLKGRFQEANQAINQIYSSIQRHTQASR